MNSALSARPLTRPRLAIHAAILALVAAAMALRLWHLGHQSLWNDELFSVFYARQNLDYILGPGREIETNPPLYYLLLSFWMKAFGTGETAVRLLSAIFSLAALPVVYRIGQALRNDRAGFLAALFYAVSGLQVYYAQEARPYSLFALTAALGILGCVRLLKSCDGRESLVPGALMFGAGAILTVYAHDAGIVFVAAADLMLAASLLAVRRRAALLAAILAVNIVICVAWLPQAFVLLRQSQSANLAWLDQTGLGWAAATLAELASGLSLVSAVKDRTMPAPVLDLAFAAVALCAAVAFLCFCRVALRCRRDWPILAICILLPGIGYVLLFGISQARPILLARTAIWLTVPLYLLLAIGIGTLTGRTFRRCLLVAFLIAEAGLCAARLAYDEKEPWRRLVTETAAASFPGDVFVLTAGAESRTPATPFAYYWRGAARPDLRRWASCTGPCPTTSEAVLDALVAPEASIGLAEIGEILAAGRGVWLVSRTPLGPRDEAQMSPIYGYLIGIAQPLVRFDWQGKILISRWQKN